MLVITQPEFNTTSWKAAVPDIEIYDHKKLPKETTQRLKILKRQNLVLLLSETPEWEELMKELKLVNTPFIIMSRNSSMDEFKKVVRAGAKGYIDALSYPESLKAATQSVLSGALWIPEPFISLLTKSISKKLTKISEPDLSPLSKKEIEVAQRISNGTSNKEIAEVMNISERTVKSHLTHIYNKLNLRDRMQLMLYMQGRDINNQTTQ